MKATKTTNRDRIELASIAVVLTIALALGILSAASILLLLPMGAVMIFAAMGLVLPVVSIAMLLDHLFPSKENDNFIGPRQEPGFLDFTFKFLLPAIALSALTIFCPPVGVACFGLIVAFAVAGVLGGIIEKCILPVRKPALYEPIDESELSKKDEHLSHINMKRLSAACCENEAQDKIDLSEENDQTQYEEQPAKTSSLKLSAQALKNIKQRELQSEKNKPEEPSDSLSCAL